MAIVKVRDINGNWIPIPIIATSNADTLDGFHASHFATASDMANINTQLGNISLLLDDINGEVI